MAHSAVSVQPAMMVSNNMVTEWSSGVCDCCKDMNICCCGCLCPCFLMCKTSKEFGECLCLPLLEICFGCLFHPITLSVRSSMRERFHIKGSIQDDCCVACCCPLCVWCQMARELKVRRQSAVVVTPTANVVHQPQTFNQPTQAAYQPTQAAYQPTQAAYQPTQTAYQPTQAANQPTQAAYQPLIPANRAY